MPPASPMADWDHTLFADLQHLLGRVVAQPTTSTLRRLFQKLDEARPWLVCLTNIPGPSEADKQRIEKGPTTTPNGASIQLSGDLLTSAQQISEKLSISQLLAATLVLQSEEERPRYPSRSNFEIATFTYHEWTGQMLDFLRELLRLTAPSEADLSPPFDQLRNWVDELLTIRTPLASGGEGTLVDQIISQLDVAQGRISKLLQERSGSMAEYESVSFRIAAVRSEQCKMAGILAGICEAGIVGKAQVLRMLKWLKKVEKADVIMTTVLASLFAALRPLEMIDPAHVRYDMVDGWIRDVKFLRLAASHVLQEEWKIPQLRDGARLAFCMFYLSALRHDAAVATTGIEAPMAEQFILDALAGDALRFLRETILAIRRERGLEEQDEAQAAAEDALVKLATRSDPDNDDIIIRQIQELVDGLAVKKNFLRNLRNKEEDVSIRRSQVAPPPTYYQDFLWLMATVYRSLPPDSAEDFWDSTAFIGVLLDTRGNFPGPAFWALLTALSTGPACAAKCFERMKDSRLPWSALFKFYQHYFDILPHLFEPMKSNRSASLDPMSQEEVDICIGWTKLLSTVVRYSPLARSALMQHKPHPLQQLFDFVNCDIPNDLRAAILDAITAFCSRTGEAVDDDIRNRAVEHFERISYADPSLDSRFIDPARLPPPIGWIAKTEYAEVDAQTYPVTRAYIQFLTILLPSPSTTPTRLAPRVANVLRRGIHYVLDRILLVPGARRYLREAERWEMLDGIFALMERALLAFDMSDLVTQVDHRSVGAVATALSEEPGFTVFLRVLGEQQIFAVLAGLVDSAMAGPSPRPAHILRPLRRVLRMYHRILDVQLVFSDVLLLTLSDPSRNSTHPFRRPLSLQSLDQYLLTHLSNVNAIALLVGDDDLAVSLVSLKILQALATSPVFSRNDIFRGEYSSSVNRLAGIIDASDDSIRIAQGFCTRLDGTGDTMTSGEIHEVERRVLAGTGGHADREALPIVIRSAILDLLIEGTHSDISGPTLAHFLLGFDFKAGDFGLQDPRLPDSRLSCLHIVLRQLSEGSSEVCLGDVHPLLAAKSAQLIHQLFSRSVTGKSTMSYASSISGFSERQLTDLPRYCPSAPRDDLPGAGIAQSAAGEVGTTAETLVAYLDFQKWIIAAVSLDVFAFEGNGTSASEIAELVFHGTDGAEDGDDSGGSRPPLIVDVLANIDLQWREETDPAAQSRALDFFGSFDFDQFKRADVDWWDVEALEKTMRSYRRHLQKTGSLSTDAAVQAIEAEMTFVLQRLGQKNRETDISLAKGSFLTSWNAALKVSLAMLFKYIAEEQQEVVLFELLDALLDRLAGDLVSATGVLEILCESVLVVMTALVNMLGEFEGANLPVDRLSAALQAIVDIITRPGTTESARGNLYAAIGQYLTLLTPSASFGEDGSVAGSVMTVGTALPGQPLNLHRTTLAVIAAKKDRFFATLCRDAADDRDVWKTECFALLGALVGVCQTERDRQAISPLSQGGYLPLFLRSIKDREIALQECLSPSPENLHAYWVYESKIAFLTAVASTRKGAEDLLDAGVFEVFAMCGFMAVQPISEDVLADPTVAEIVIRQHRVLIYALQLIVRVLSSLNKSSRSGAGHGISLLNAHRDSLLVLLRENQMAVTLTGIEETRLIVSILAMVVHKVPVEDLRSPTGFGAFHLGVLSIAARFFDHDAWTGALINPNETHEAESDVLALNHTLLVYLCGTTAGLKSGTATPVLVTGAHRQSDTSNKYLASAPSLQMAVDLLADLTEDLGDVGSDYEIVLERMQDGGELDAGDRLQSGVLKEEADTETALAAYTQRGQMLFNMIESVLLLVWRHLLFYANDARGAQEHVRPGDLAASLGAFSGSQLDASRSKAGTVRVLERIAGGLRGTLERLDDVDVHPDLQQRNDKGAAYHGMLIRRVGELISGLAGEAAEQ
ncbi:nucleoporin Nup186/Nup192/Nup205 [Dioszegia hungarica]|uniref:Nucleoporin Nup186/Nup192/Nup205 n=1 Tax=Dioszegia hungarica TaxID=4972 RepID=A0AA38LS32_9TREE|nr:nucleoporin Nup186/Nup192/Nup205 [Dioszegia hungarica]KAI9632114.1 nucleoporin Nup186/Nup192/Nup205 [Dioszegia hungarica]